MTRLDIVTLALRRCGITAADEEPTADQFSIGSQLLDAIYGELQGEALLPWTVDDVPAASSVALSLVLAADLAPMFQVQPPIPRGIAWLRLLGTVRADNRPATEPVDY